MGEPAKYDAIVVGAGVSGSLVAKQLAKAGKRVLVLEAGPGSVPPFGDRKGYQKKFYSSLAKVPSAPYPPYEDSDPGKLNAQRATVLMIQDWRDPTKSYLTYDEKSPLPFGSSYERVVGGTTQHWMGSSYRFLPADFEMRTRYGREAPDWPKGMVDWPLGYGDLDRFYNDAETELGVASDKIGHGIPWDPGYEHPMRRIPPTVLDKALGRALEGAEYGGQPLSVSSTPAARNSIKYAGRPACGGNTSCIPMCPIRAKYDATVTLQEAMQTGNVELISKAVVESVSIDPQTRRISAVNYVRYEDPSGPPTGRESVSARIYVLAAHAFETPKILLNSACEAFPHGAANEHDQVGRYLMDHPYYVEWGLAEQPIYPFRGPLITSYIGNLRDGEFRRHRAAFLVDIGNDGWGFSVGDPATSVLDFVDGTNEAGTNRAGKRYFGRTLIDKLNHHLTRQWRLGFQIEQSPEADNRVTLSKQHTDNLGIPRPEVHYDISEYTKKGFKAARETAKKIVTALGERYTCEKKKRDSPAQFEYDGEWYQYAGAGHIVGTYRMGSRREDSVVNDELRSWDHANLFLVGSGVFPTITTANPTLTIAALSLKAARHMLEDLDR